MQIKVHGWKYFVIKNLHIFALGARYMHSAQRHFQIEIISQIIIALPFHFAIIEDDSRCVLCEPTHKMQIFITNMYGWMISSIYNNRFQFNEMQWTKDKQT